MSPLVTVVIPTFNRGWIIRKAVESVLDQTHKPIELILINDGSTDDTLSVLDSFNDRIKIINQTNRGVSAARNAGIREASGEFIAFLDSDDYWHKKKIECQLSYFKKNPDADICQCEEIWIRKGKRVNPKFKHKKPSGYIFEQSLHLCLVSPSAVIIRKTLFEKKGVFDESLTACEDYDFWLRISCDTPVYLTPEQHVIKNGGHDDQLSAMPGLDRFRIRSLQKILDSGNLNESQYRLALEVMARKCEIYAAGCAKRNKQEEAEYYNNIYKNYTG